MTLINKEVVQVTPKTTSARTRTVINRGIITHKDLLDQPRGKYLLVLDPGPMSSHMFFVDKVEVTNKLATATKSGKVVVEFSPQLSWYLVNTNYIETLTTEEMWRRNAEDSKLMEQLKDELHPEKPNDQANEDGIFGSAVGNYL